MPTLHERVVPAALIGWLEVSWTGGMGCVHVVFLQRCVPES
jgi:hypothetical protein